MWSSRQLTRLFFDRDMKAPNMVAKATILALLVALATNVKGEFQALKKLEIGGAKLDLCGECRRTQQRGDDRFRRFLLLYRHMDQLPRRAVLQQPGDERGMHLSLIHISEHTRQAE